MNRLPARRSHWRWLLAVAAAAIVAVAVIYGPVLLRSPWERMMRAAQAAKERPLLARISGFPWAPYRTRRVVEASATGLQPLRGAAEDVLSAGPAPASSADLHERGVAHLLADKRADAVRLLRRAATSANDARYWSDLAAAELANAPHDAQASTRALAAADRALMLDPALLEAKFNRALAIEAIGVRKSAIDAWDSYAASDSTSQWAAEARQHRAALQAAIAPDNWQTDQPLLEQAALANDRDTVLRLVGTYRQKSRSHGELTYPRQWAAALQAGDAQTAAARLSVARAIGDALVTISGESLLHDALAAIDSAASPAALAAAYVAYDDARQLLNAHRYADALPVMTNAAQAFRGAGSPMALVAEYYRAICLYAQPNFAASLALLQQTDDAAPERYRALHAQVWWERGAVYSSSGRLNDARHAYELSASLFDTLGETANADTMRGDLTAIYSALGRAGDAWRIWTALLRTMQSDAAVAVVVDTAARLELAAERWEGGRSLLALSLALDPSQKAARTRASADVWRARAADRLGWSAAAADDLQAARNELPRVLDPAARSAAENDIRLAEGTLAVSTNPALAEQLLTATITALDGQFYLPEAYRQRARARRTLSRNADAIADLRAALAILEQRRNEVDIDEQRDSAFDTAAGVARELVDLLDRSGDAGATLDAAERTRGRLLVDRLGGGDPTPLSAGALVAALPPHTVVVHYTVLSDRVVILTVTHDGVSVARSSVAEDELAATTSSLLDALRTNDTANSASLSERLHALLIAPIASRLAGADLLVVIPDNATARVPFAALHPNDGVFLIQQLPLVYAPNATAYARARPRDLAKQSLPPHAVAVGNPAFDASLFSNLVPLPDAEDEARQIAAMMPGTVLLTGAAATRERVMTELRTATMTHIATHAVLDDADPRQSCLLFTPSAGNRGFITVRDIAALRLPSSRLVVLAGCRTAFQDRSGEGDVRSLAIAFLAAGTSNVVGTLWKVDDNHARQLTVRFHEALARGLSPAAALRDAQLLMLRSGDPALNRPGAWAAFGLHGTGV